MVLVAFPPLILKKKVDLGNSRGDCFIKVEVKTKYIIQHTTKQSLASVSELWDSWPFTVSYIAIV